MPTETKPPRPETDEDLLSRAPAHDGVATQRDLREMERYLVTRFDAKLDKLNSKMDRITWLIIGGLGIIVASLIAILVQV